MRKPRKLSLNGLYRAHDRALRAVRLLDMIPYGAGSRAWDSQLANAQGCARDVAEDLRRELEEAKAEVLKEKVGPL